MNRTDWENSAAAYEQRAAAWRTLGNEEVARRYDRLAESCRHNAKPVPGALYEASDA